MAQNSIIYEEMLALLSFLFDEYSVFYDTVIQVCPPFISALEGSDEIVGKYDPIIEIRCWVCGNVYYAHKFAPLFGVGCPHCNRRSSDDDIAMRYLSHLGDGKYRLMEPFKGFGKRTEVMHQTCGRIRNVNFSDMIWGRRCCTCELKLPLKEIQQRVDPTEIKFRVLKYSGAKGEKQKVRIKCLVCGDEFETQLAVFLKHPYCRACMEGSRYRENFKKQVIELGHGEYDLVTPYVNEKTKVKIRHRRCFTETDMYPGNFIAGQRCALCTPVNKEEREFSIRSSVYMAIRDICDRNGGICLRENINDMLVFSTNVISSAIRNLVRSGYILQLGGGAYGFHPYDQDEVAYRKYIFRNGHTEGVYGYDSAAYNEGITDEKPEVGYIFTNLVSHDDAFRVTINDKIFKVRAPLFPVTDFNKDIHTALNLLMYATVHAEKICQIRHWIDEMSLTSQKLSAFIGSYPINAARGFSLIFEDFSTD